MTRKAFVCFQNYFERARMGAARGLHLFLPVLLAVFGAHGRFWIAPRALAPPTSGALRAAASGNNKIDSPCPAVQSSPEGERNWQPLGNAEWAEMHVFKDAGDGSGPTTFRMVAWLPDTTEVILNSNLLHATAWNCNAGDFAELVNVGEPVYGFYFPDDQTVRAS